MLKTILTRCIRVVNHGHLSIHLYDQFGLSVYLSTITKLLTNTVDLYIIISNTNVVFWVGEQSYMSNCKQHVFIWLCLGTSLWDRTFSSNLIFLNILRNNGHAHALKMFLVINSQTASVVYNIWDIKVRVKAYCTWAINSRSMHLLFIYFTATYPI